MELMRKWRPKFHPYVMHNVLMTSPTSWTNFWWYNSIKAQHPSRRIFLPGPRENDRRGNKNQKKANENEEKARNERHRRRQPKKSSRCVPFSTYPTTYYIHTHRVHTRHSISGEQWTCAAAACRVSGAAVHQLRQEMAHVDQGPPGRDTSFFSGVIYVYV